MTASDTVTRSWALSKASLPNLQSTHVFHAWGHLNSSSQPPPCVNLQTILPLVEFLPDEAHPCLHLLGPALTPTHTDACPRHILACALDPDSFFKGPNQMNSEIVS